MIKELVILGATAYPEICELIYDINKEGEKYRVIALLDDNREMYNRRIEGIEVIGPLSDVEKFSNKVRFVLGIGSFRTRLIRYDILKRLMIPYERFESIIHPRAKVYSSAKLSNGVILYPGSVIFSNTVINSFVIVLANSVIGANNLVGEGVLVTSLVSTTSGVKIGSYSFIGTGSVIGENVEIGPGAMVGMGSFISKDIKAGVFAIGNPYRVIKTETVDKDILESWEWKKKESRV